MQTLRQQLKTARQNLSLKQQQQFSSAITATVINQKEFSTAKNIACYLAMPGEVQTAQIIDAIWQANKRCYLPAVVDEKLIFLAYTPETQLITSEFGFQHPPLSNKKIATEDLDLVITPLVGFDKQCHRLGMGAGHYDRAFAFLNTTPRCEKPYMLGIAYSIQEVACLSKQPWDVDLNMVITEENVT